MGGDIAIRSLAGVPHERIVAAFLEAFADYAVAMPADAEYYRARWGMEGVRPDCSFGAFSGGRLVAFVLHAVDERGGRLLAYNAGTGVVPAWRGRGLTGQLYAAALPVLSARGVGACLLEVLTGNAPAIRAYRKAGFSVKRLLRCYRGHFDAGAAEALRCEVRALGPAADGGVAGAASGAELPAWSNHPRCYAADAGARRYRVVTGGGSAAELVFNAGTGRIYELQTGETDSAVIAGMVAACCGPFQVEKKLVNLLPDSEPLAAALEALGMECYVSQFEMWREKTEV